MNASRDKEFQQLLVVVPAGINAVSSNLTESGGQSLRLKLLKHTPVLSSSQSNGPQWIQQRRATNDNDTKNKSAEINNVTIIVNINLQATFKQHASNVINQRSIVLGQSLVEMSMCPSQASLVMRRNASRLFNAIRMLKGNTCQSLLGNLPVHSQFSAHNLNECSCCQGLEPWALLRQSAINPLQNVSFLWHISFNPWILSIPFPFIQSLLLLLFFQSFFFSFSFQFPFPFSFPFNFLLPFTFLSPSMISFHLQCHMAIWPIWSITGTSVIQDLTITLAMASLCLQARNLPMSINLVLFIHAIFKPSISSKSNHLWNNVHEQNLSCATNVSWIITWMLLQNQK